MKINNLDNIAVIEIDVVEKPISIGNDFIYNHVNLKIKLFELLVDGQFSIVKSELDIFLKNIVNLKRNKVNEIQFSDLDSRLVLKYYSLDGRYYLKGELNSIGYNYKLIFEEQIDIFEIENEVSDLFILLNAL